LRDFGVVYIAWNEAMNFYHGFWEREPDGPPANMEDMPATPSLAEAVDWGRCRARKVLIRPEFDQGHYYWAGPGDPPDDWGERFATLA
jgi:hypothetical protein